MRESIKDNNTTGKKCGFHGNYFLKNVDLHILHLVIQQIVKKNLPLNLNLSKIINYFRDF